MPPFVVVIVKHYSNKKNRLRYSLLLMTVTIVKVIGNNAFSEWFNPTHCRCLFLFIRFCWVIEKYTLLK